MKRVLVLALVFIALAACSSTANTNGPNSPVTPTPTVTTVPFICPDGTTSVTFQGPHDQLMFQCATTAPKVGARKSRFRCPDGKPPTLFTTTTTVQSIRLGSLPLYACARQVPQYP